VVPPNVVSREDDNGENGDEADPDDNDSDVDADDDATEAAGEVLQVRWPEKVKSVPYRRFGINTVTI